MTQEQKDKYHAYGISAIFHIIVFMLVALTGIFAQAAQEKKPAVDVTVYDMAADNGGGGGGGSPAPAPAAELPQAIDAVALPAECRSWRSLPRAEWSLPAMPLFREG